jgi:hypothetical protein
MELGQVLIMTWYFDAGFHYDESYERIESSFELEGENVTGMNFTLDLDDCEFELECEMDVIGSVALNFLPLVPEKFRTSQILQDYLDVAELEVGYWFTSVRDIVKLLGPNTISSVEYLRYLGSIIGVKFPPEDETSEDEMKKTLISAIDWYKVKGTYHSIQIMALINQLTVNVYDMYTNDYSDFYMVTSWFVGEENENPPGFDSSYYKSPHFGVEVVLNTVYNDGSSYYLWNGDKLGNLILKVEETRPVHTVPNYFIGLKPKTDEFGNVIEVAGEIKTKIMSNWEVTTKYFDAIGTEAWNFDAGINFDESTEAYVKSMTKWVLGTGNGNIEDSGFDITNPVLTGSIDPDNITISVDKILFEFILPKSVVQNNITELGIYIPGSSDTLVLASTFPKINLDGTISLRVVVEVDRSNLV